MSAQWTDGFDQLAAHVQTFTPEWAAPITELPAEQIRATARVMAERCRRSVIVPGRHATWYGNDTQRMRAVYIINALLGAYGREGGLYFNKPPYIEAYPHPPFAVVGSAGGCSAEPGARGRAASRPHRQGACRRRAREVPARRHGHAGADRADDHRQAVSDQGADRLRHQPAPHHPQRAAHQGGAQASWTSCSSWTSCPRSTSPGRTWCCPRRPYLERYDELWTVAHKTPYIALREPAVAPLYDTKPAWWIARELGLRLGLETYFQWETVEEYLNPADVDRLRAWTRCADSRGVIIQKGKPYLEDFDGQLALPHGQRARSSSIPRSLALAGHDPMPVYEPVEEPPAGYLRLLYGRHPVHTFAKTQNTPLLTELYPENEVWVNESVAAALGFADGDRLAGEPGRRAQRPGQGQGDAAHPPGRSLHGARLRANAPGMTQAQRQGRQRQQTADALRAGPISGGAGMRVNFVRIVKEA